MLMSVRLFRSPPPSLLAIILVAALQLASSDTQLIPNQDTSSDDMKKRNSGNGEIGLPCELGHVLAYSERLFIDRCFVLRGSLRVSGQ